MEKGKTTFPELASNIAQVAPLAASMNITFEEVAASVASLTKQGVNTPMAFTQIRQAILSVNDVLGDGWQKSMTFQEALQKVRDMAGGSDT
ncbi:MAG: phage tail tape measure protein, partial [Mariniphaga sp.]